MSYFIIKYREYHRNTHTLIIFLTLKIKGLNTVVTQSNRNVQINMGQLALPKLKYIITMAVYA